MVEADRQYVSDLVRAGLIKGPTLELGGGYGGETCREVIRAAGLEYFSTDLAPAAGVDFVADFENPADMGVFKGRRFQAVLVLNVIEHTFSPVQILDNALSLLEPGGLLVTLTPAIWPLHQYPLDVWRPMPNFYEEYALRRKVELLDEYFLFTTFGRVRDFGEGKGAYHFPLVAKRGLRSLVSHVVHWAFSTYGRGMFHPSHVSIAATFRK